MDCFYALKQFFGELWVQNVILTITAVIGIWTIGSSSRNEKRRATVDIVRNQTTDSRLKAAREKFRSLRNRNADFIALFQDQASEDFLHVREVLNAYEFMAAGVREKAFDEKIYKRMYYTNVVTDWRTLKSFVLEYRKSRGPTVYQEFEWLASRWADDPLKTIHN